MSEELYTDDNKKKNLSKKKDKMIENYQYNSEPGEVLIMDKPSESLNKINIETKKDNIMKSEQKPILKSNKELYESYVKELRYFSLSLNNDIIYDSSIDNSKESPLKFENDFFILYGKKYSYNGLKIQKINKR